MRKSHAYMLLALGTTVYAALLIAIFMWNLLYGLAVGAVILLVTSDRVRLLVRRFLNRKRKSAPHFNSPEQHSEN